MAGVTVGARVLARNHLGQFLAKVDRAIVAGLESTVRHGAEVAIAAAPEKTGELKATIEPVMLSDREAALTVGTHYWKYQEYGTRPHDITGHVRFWWEKEGREWEPGANIINHPGNPGLHFMEKARAEMVREFAQSIRDNM